MMSSDAASSALASGVRQLGEDLTAMTVHRRREAGQARHHRVVVDAGLPRRVAPPGVAKHMTAQNQAHAVARQILVDLDEFIRDLAAVIRRGLGRTGTHDPVGGLDGADAAGPEQSALSHYR